MIDTVRLKSPYLSSEQADQIEQKLMHRIAYRVGDQEPEYHITSDHLRGSWDNRIMVRLMREELAYVSASAIPDRMNPEKNPLAKLFKPTLSKSAKAVYEKKVTKMVPCAPYIVVEGSVHKAMVGHNITGGPQGFQEASCWFVDKIAELLWVHLPHGSMWAVERVDVTECYQLPYEAIEEFIGSLNRAEYPRRKRRAYGLESLQFGGVTTGFSLYHKGPEFSKHDAKLLRDRLGPSLLSELQALANGIMRVEISVKGRKLKADSASGLLGVEKGEKVLVVQVTDAYLQRVHDQEVARVIREGHKDMQTVRTHQEVMRRLDSQYDAQLAGALYGLWVRLSTEGEKEAKKRMSRPTFYRQRKQLVKAGCSWAGTDIIIRHSSIPFGFSLRRSDPHRDAVEDPAVTALLAPYRRAA